MNAEKNDPVFSYLKEHAEAVPEQSRSARFQLFAELKDLREKFFKKTLVWVPVIMSSLILVLFVGMNFIQSHRQSEASMNTVSDAKLEAFLEESFSSYSELAETQQELALDF